jgi:hypothetical protein
VGEDPQQVPGPVHSLKEREEVQLVRLEDLHVEEGAAAAVESEHLVGFLVEDHTGRAAAGAAVDVMVG